MIRRVRHDIQGEVLDIGEYHADDFPEINDALVLSLNDGLSGESPVDLTLHWPDGQRDVFTRIREPECMIR